MGGTKSLMGLTVTISCLAGIPPLLVSDKIFRTIGHPNVQIIGFAVYLIRLIGYSYIDDPYLCLVYEVMESVTTALMVTSMMAYAAQLGTTTTVATIQGLICAFYYGLGRGSGTLIGGFLIKWFGSGNPDKTYGARATFRVLGVAAAITAVLYLGFNFFYSRYRIRKTSSSNKKDETLPPATAKELGINNPAFVVASNEELH